MKGVKIWYNMGMKTQKLTPKDKKEIAVRVAAGEKQGDLVKEYDVSPALISRVVKQSRDGYKKSKSDAPISKLPVNVSGKTIEQLRNRYRQIHLDLLRHNGELQQRLLEADGLQQSIEVGSQKDESVRDESWLLAQKKRLTWCLDTTQTGYEMARLYQEASAILQTFVKRNVSVPYSVSTVKGLIPGIQSEVRLLCYCRSTPKKC